VKSTRKRKKAAAPVMRTRSVSSSEERRVSPARGSDFATPLTTPASKERWPGTPVIAPKSRAMNGAPEVVELNEIQSTLEAKLKDWRREQARAAGLPSFFIFSDTVLHSIVLTRPKTVGELREVRGIGPEKLDRFGAAVVELCRA